MAVSLLPSLLVLMELLIYRGFGPALSQKMHVLNVFLLGSKNSNLVLRWGGTWAVPVVVFIETGLFFGFFLPGDSLLIACGVLGAIGQVNLTSLIPLSILAAIGGDQLNYAIGRRSHEALATRFKFVRNNMRRASEFYLKHGGRMIVLARFLPVVRTFAPAAAGASRMNYSKFTFYNVTGGILWVTSMTVTGYFVGAIIPNVTDYVYSAIAVVIVTSLLTLGLIWFWHRINGRLHR